MTDNSDRAERYAKRLDAHLANFGTDAARRKCLEGEARRWQQLYLEWAQSVDRGDEPDSGATAYDYILTLCEIDIRLAKYLEPGATYPGTDAFSGLVDTIVESGRKTTDNTQTTWSA